MSDRLVTNSLADSAVTGNIISSGTITGEKIAPGAITLAKLEPSFASKFAAGVKITNLYYEGFNTFADIDGGQTITLIGSGFTNNTRVIVNKTIASNVTVINQFFITFVTPPNPRGFHNVFVDNLNGATNFLPFGISYIPLLKFRSDPGSFGNIVYSDNTYFEKIAAVGDGTLVYTLESGTMPSGLTFNSNGTITGVPQTLSTGSVNFNASVYDNNLNKIYRDFYLTLAGGARVTVITYSGTVAQGANSASTAGGDTITLTGVNFISGGNVVIGNAAARSVTFVDSTTVRFTTVATAIGIYNLRYNNVNGTFALRTNAFFVRPPITWVTAAGSIGNASETFEFITNISATADADISYVLTTGSLPGGLSFFSNGVLRGTAIQNQANVQSFTSYSFTVTATGYYGQISSRSFSIDLYPRPSVNSLTFPTYFNGNVFLSTLAANVGGGETITVRGAGFRSGLRVFVDNVTVSNTYVSNTQLTFITPAKSAGSYNFYVRNTDNTFSTNVLIAYSSTPVWSQGNVLPAISPNSNYFANVWQTYSVVSDSSILYYFLSNVNLPAGITINANSGVLSGNASIIYSNLYSFDITVVDTEFQSSRKTISVSAISNTFAADYFIVGGGGGAAGGGGGVIQGSTLIVTGVVYDAVVGAGSTNYGPGRGGDSYVRSRLDNSYLGGIFAYGGGNGGYSTYPPTYVPGQTEGSDGGSGGGSGSNGGLFGTSGGRGVYPGSTFVNAARQGYDGVGGYYYISGAGGGAANSSRGNGVSGLYGGYYGGNGIYLPAAYVQDNFIYASGAPNNDSERRVNSGCGGGDSGVVILRSQNQAVTSGNCTVTNQAGGWKQYKFTGTGTITFL